jgi:predicted homoserine dehydrogenase-like protein
MSVIANLPSRLRRRIEAAGPIRVGLIGAGKFGSMFLAQVPTSPHLEVVAIADLDPERARTACRTVGWSEERVARTTFLEDGAALIADARIEVVIEATGSPLAGVRHALAAAAEGKHMVMVNVEADVLAGPWLAAEARRAGVVYSQAYGDQPALVCEMVDWARTCGFAVVAAGKGTRYQPHYHALTPATVWGQYGLTKEAAREAGMNAQMFCSFMDGTKSAIEMAAIANATGLKVPDDGLAFPPCSMDNLQDVLRPKDEGGVLAGSGFVEVVSSMQPGAADDMERHLRWGVYVVFEAPNDYARACFSQYGLKTDATGRFASLYRPYHLIGLELGVSVVEAALRGEPTGAPEAWRSDVVAVAKRDLEPGEVLDGEGGYYVWGKLVPAPRSRDLDALPIGLAHGISVTRPISQGAIVTLGDVSALPGDAAVAARRDMVRHFG